MRPPKSLLKDSHPELAKQVVDKSLLETLSTGAEKKILWECEKGHRWEAKVYNRTNAKNKTGCPVCSGKKIIPGVNDIKTLYPDVFRLAKNKEDVQNIAPSSTKKIWWKCEKGHEWEARIQNVVSGQRCPYCSGRYAIPGKTDLATTHPKLAGELVDKSLATILKAGSARKVEWECENGHRYFATPYSRTHKNTGCPYCSGRNIIKGENDFNTLYPKLAKTLVNFEDGFTVGRASEKKLKFKCEKCGYEWETTPRNRIMGGCPVCANKIIIPGVNDLATTHPDIAAELVDKNLAKKISYGSGKKVEWECEKGHRWVTSPSHRTGKNESHNRTGCPICNPTGRSNVEKELAKIIKKLVPNEKVIENDKKLLSGKKELDIVIPKKKIAIEFNGTRWHCELMEKDKNYHKNKTDECNALGYQLIHIWEDDWNNKKEIIIKMLAHKLNAIDNLKNILPDLDKKNYERVFARNLHFGVADSKTARKFLDENHIQGKTTGKYHFGLFDEAGELRAVMTVRSAKNNARMRRNEGEWEIQRYASIGSVVGGFSKLLKNAEEFIKNSGEIINKWISFSAADVSNGNMYEKTGFVKKYELAPDYKYVGEFTNWIRVPKESFQKKRFKSDKNLKWKDEWTEHEAALANNLYRIYDAGKIKWVKDVL